MIDEKQTQTQKDRERIVIICEAFQTEYGRWEFVSHLVHYFAKFITIHCKTIIRVIVALIIHNSSY